MCQQNYSYNSAQKRLTEFNLLSGICHTFNTLTFNVHHDAPTASLDPPLLMWNCLLQVSCSNGGLCIGSKALALTTTTPPVMTLRTNAYILSVVTVKQGKSYAACASGQQPTSGSTTSPSLLSSVSTMALLILVIMLFIYLLSQCHCNGVASTNKALHKDNIVLTPGSSNF